MKNTAFALLILSLAILVLNVAPHISANAVTVPLWYTRGDTLKSTVMYKYLTFGLINFNRNGTANNIVLSKPKIGTNGTALDSIKITGTTPDTLCIYVGSKVTKLQLN